MSRPSYFRELVVMGVETFADSWATKYVRPAFDGDLDAARRLCVALTNPKRGSVAVAMWRAKVSLPAYRAFLTAAWEHDHGYVKAAARSWRTLAPMFRYAELPLPSDFGPTVRAWRGTSGVTLTVAKRGHSWSLDRDVACWFAMRLAKQHGRPLVLIAEVPRDSVVLYTDERSEREVVVMGPVLGARVDGTPEDWAAGHERNRRDWSVHLQLCLGHAESEAPGTAVTSDGEAAT